MLKRPVMPTAGFSLLFSIQRGDLSQRQRLPKNFFPALLQVPLKPQG